MVKKIKTLNFKSVYKPSAQKFGTWPEWLLLGMVFLFAYFIFMYIDITNTIDNSVLFTKALFSGEILNFYDYTIDNASTNFPANYEIIAYIPFAIWNLPLAIGNMAFGFDYMHSTLALLWAKGVIVVFAVITLYVFYKILRLCSVSKEMSSLACFVLVTSLMFFWPVFLIVQIDIPAVLLMVLGLYFYLKCNEKLFILCFAIAIPFKMFALMLFVPLLVFREKRILVIIAKCIFVALPELLCMFIYRNSEAYDFALKSQSRDAMNSLLNYTETIGTRKLSLFIVAFFAVCVFCYVYKLKDKSSDLQLSMPIYISSLIYGALMIFVQIRGYWLIYLAPFLILSIFISNKFIKLNLLLETLSGFCFIMWYSLAGGGASTDQSIVWRLLLYKFVDQPGSNVLKYKNLQGLFSAFGLDNFKFAFFTVFVCSLSAILILTCPLLFKKYKKDTYVERTVILLRPLVLIGLVVIYIFAYTSTTNSVIYDTINNKNISSEFDLLSNNSNNTVSEKLKFDNEYELETLGVVFDNSNPRRNNFCSVNITIENLSTNETIFTKRVGCSMIKSGEETEIDLNKLYVNSNDSYEITFTAQDGVDESIIGYKNSIALYKTNELIYSDHPAMENGVEKDYNLAISIR